MKLSERTIGNVLDEAGFAKKPRRAHSGKTMDPETQLQLAFLRSIGKTVWRH